MALRLSERIPYEKVKVDTPLGIKVMKMPEDNPVLITILRAGGPFLDGFLEIFDQSDVGFIGAYRVETGEDRPQIKMNYKALPVTAGKTVFLLDPMLATGKSMIDAARMIVTNGLPSKIYFISAVAAPEGIQAIRDQVEVPFEIWTGSLDEKLNPNAYIVPGLGDAGDLSYGPKI